MDKLPSETLELILEYASTGVLLTRYERPASERSFGVSRDFPPFHGRGMRMRWLASLQLVSKQFLKVVRSFAYNEIAVSSVDQLHLLTDHLEQHADLVLQPISLVITASDPKMSGGLLDDGAEPWKDALLRFARCRSSIRRLELYGPVDPADQYTWSIFDLTWVQAFASSLEHLLLAHVVLLHHLERQEIWLPNLHTLTLSDHCIRDPTSELPVFFNLRPFLSQLNAVRHLELINKTSIVLSFNARDQRYLPFPHPPNLHPRILHRCQCSVLRLERQTPVMDVERLSTMDTPFTTLTFVGAELFRNTNFQQTVSACVASLRSNGQVVETEIKFVTLQAWAFSRVDMAGLNWAARPYKR